MPNIKSAKKRVLVTATKAAHNRMANSAFKTEMKNIRASVETATDKEAVLALAYKKIDQACAAGIMHPNTAARRKSALAKACAKA